MEVLFAESRKYFYLGLLLLVAASVTACKEKVVQKEPVRSYLYGRITVNARIDPSHNYGGFDLLVATGLGSKVDTLGHAVTDSTGAFTMDVTAEEAGIYPLMISRNNTILKVGELVVASGDSAELRAELPMGNRPLLIRSKENAAWMAFVNTRSLHSQALLRLASNPTQNRPQMDQMVGQTVAILWGMQQTYDSTIGADFAAAQSVVMLEGWNDTLLVERAREISPDNPGFGEVVGAARRTVSKKEGLDASLLLLDEFIGKTDDPRIKAEVKSEYVRAYMDYGMVKEAKQSAREIVDEFPQTNWADWAKRVVYDFEYLMPGMIIPDFSFKTRDKESFSLHDLRGDVVLLEFYTPHDPQYLEELGIRNSIRKATLGARFSVVSVSMEPDTTLNDAFAKGREFPGIHVIIPDTVRVGKDVTRKFNIHLLPRRFLIDPEGKIIAKYEGPSMMAIQSEIASMLGQYRPTRR